MAKYLSKYVHFSEISTADGQKRASWGKDQQNLKWGLVRKKGFYSSEDAFRLFQLVKEKQLASLLKENI